MKINPHIALSDTGFLFHAATGDSFSVNPTGLRIIQLIKEGKQQDEVVTQLIDEFEVGPDQADEDLSDFLQFLRQLKILIDE